MSMEKVSLIIPVYNGENHIGECIENLLNQTYKNIEILIVNDGSKDRTKEIIEFYAHKDDRIIIINKENGGVSSARNCGIEKSTGDYIMFVDSDDSLVSNAVEYLVLNSNGDDLILFGFTVMGTKNRKNDTETLKKISLIDKKYIRNQLLKAIMSTRDNVFGYIWRAVYSRNLIKENNIFFPESIKISEDYWFLLNIVKNAKKIKILSDELYIYKIGESSMSIKYIPSILNDMDYVNKWMYNNLVKDNEEFEIGYYCSVANTYLRYLQNNFRKSDSFYNMHMEVKQQKKKYKGAIDKTWYRFNKFPLKSFIAIILFKFNLEIVYEVLFYFKQKI